MIFFALSVIIPLEWSESLEARFPIGSPILFLKSVLKRTPKGEKCFLRVFFLPKTHFLVATYCYAFRY